MSLSAGEWIATKKHKKHKDITFWVFVPFVPLCGY